MIDEPVRPGEWADIKQKPGCKFSVGDVVRLATGGPKMTVLGGFYSGLGRGWTVRCAWFIDTSLEVAEFNEQALDISETEDK